ncbi:AAA family ATPase [bacterium]|nr:AAA family ATPase [bacterium]
MKVISVINQKGGCGKTTTAINFSASLGLSGKKVLLLDLDPQAHATLGLGIDPYSVTTTLYSYLNENDIKDLKSLCVKVEKNLDILPSSINMAAVEQVLGRRTRNKEKWLETLLASFKNDYDYVIIDSPPSVGLLAINALVASDIAIVPVDTSIYSVNGARITLDTINVIKERLGSKIDVKLLSIMYDKRSNTCRELFKQCKAIFKDMCFATKIRSSIKVREAAMKGKSIFSFDKGNVVAQDYNSLKKEFVDIFEKHSDLGPKFVFDKVKFIVKAPNAQNVEVAGDFNNWRPDLTKLEKKDGEVWVKELEIPLGRYEYKLVVDGIWMKDPYNNNAVKNPFGEYNSVLNYVE